MATILINERGCFIVEPISQDNALIIAQRAKNLYDEIMRQVAAQNGNYAAEYAPRQPEQSAQYSRSEQKEETHES